MDKNRCIFALALALIWIACPTSVFAQKSNLQSISELEKDDATLRAQEKVLLGKLSPDSALPVEQPALPPTVDPELTALSTETANLSLRSDRLNSRLDLANKEAEEILLRARLASEHIQQLQTIGRFLDSGTRSKSAQDLPIAYVVSKQASLVADPEQPEVILATVVRGTPVFIEYLAQNQYRIVTSTGVRGWLSGNDLEFLADNFHPASSLVRIKAIQPTS